MSITGVRATTKSFQKEMVEFYDNISGLWENILGDHMHYGFYEPGSHSDPRSAQIRMIEESLHFASISDEVEKPTNIIDVGCGLGGSSRYLAKKYGAICQGITLSPVQAKRAQEITSSEGLDDKVSFHVADALNQPFPDAQFDLIWSMESAEHMTDKTMFVNELARVAAPGGTIIIVTWCHRNLSPPEESLRQEEKELLNKLCGPFYIPEWSSTSDYVKLLQSSSLEDIKVADWSQYVAPFSQAIVNSSMTWKGISSLLRSGWNGIRGSIRGSLATPLVKEALKTGLVKFAIITCRKPGVILRHTRSNGAEKSNTIGCINKITKNI